MKPVSVLNRFYPVLLLGPALAATLWASGGSADDVCAQTGAAPPGQRVILQGGVSLDDAMALEGHVQEGRQAVDWYGWYLRARESITGHGGLQCALGTPIRINKEGSFQTSAPEPVCQRSVARQWFPLPQDSRLPAIILLVRSGAWQPMTPNELMQRVR